MSPRPAWLLRGSGRCRLHTVGRHQIRQHLLPRTLKRRSRWTGHRGGTQCCQAECQQRWSHDPSSPDGGPRRDGDGTSAQRVVWTRFYLGNRSLVKTGQAVLPYDGSVITASHLVGVPEARCGLRGSPPLGSAKMVASSRTQQSSAFKVHGTDLGQMTRRWSGGMGETEGVGEDGGRPRGCVAAKQTGPASPALARCPRSRAPFQPAQDPYCTKPSSSEVRSG